MIRGPGLVALAHGVEHHVVVHMEKVREDPGDNRGANCTILKSTPVRIAVHPLAS